MSAETGGIATFCYCSHHVLDHVGACSECACPGFVAKSAASWQTGELALGPLLRRYDTNDLIKEDSR